MCSTTYWYFLFALDGSLKLIRNFKASIALSPLAGDKVCPVCPVLIQMKKKVSALQQKVIIFSMLVCKYLKNESLVSRTRRKVETCIYENHDYESKGNTFLKINLLCALLAIGTLWTECMDCIRTLNAKLSIHDHKKATIRSYESLVDNLKIDHSVWSYTVTNILNVLEIHALLPW